MTRRRVWLFSLFGLALIPIIFIIGSPCNDIGWQVKRCVMVKYCWYQLFTDELYKDYAFPRFTDFSGGLPETNKHWPLPFS
jgi:hypothetical protein